ncbi:hypothetical protein [Massilia sp. TN1-12]|uniref:hypothetical protein n=1 Tax=Massilia paldalensis TaxID=3377675 RepID=UPI0038512E7E
MGFLKQLVGLEGASQTGNSTSTSSSTTKTTLDPAIQSLIFGNNGSGGLLSQFSSLLNKPQDAGLQQYGNANNNFLGTYGGQNLNSIQQAAQGLLAGTGTPTVSAAGASLPAYAVGNQIKAPAQNGIDLSGTFNTLLGGGNTDALMKSLQAGNALTNEQLAQNQGNTISNFQKTVLPSIRGGAIAAGQYGSSRQGIAEGNAIGDLTKQLNDQSTQVSLANSANNANALAGAYENGQNRALSAAQGLSAQQYGVAGQNANTANQAEFMNVGNSFDASKYNAGLQQQANLANQQAQFTNNAQNNGAAVAGSGLLSGLMGQAYGVGSNQNNYQLGQYGAINSLLAPYLNANATTTTNGTNSQPIYENRGQSFLSSVGSLASLFG